MIQSKRSISKSGKNNPCYGRTGNKHPMFGKKQSKESNEKRRKSMEGKNIGKDNGMYKEKIKWICPECGTVKYLNPSEATHKKYCSLECANIGENNPAYGKIQSEESNKKRSKAMSGEKHPFYSNNPTVSLQCYRIHRWIEKHKGKASNYKCIDCDKQAYHWSNINNHIHRRKLDDYVPRCSSCHLKYDAVQRKNNLLK